MKYRRLGNTGLRISSVSIGGWVTVGGTVDIKASQEIIRTAVDAGINFVDLADVYAGGKAEEVVGGMMGEFTRSDLVLSSKVYWPMSKNVNDRGLSRKHIMESCERSLQRLQTDYLDIYFCHRYDEETPLEETVRAMSDLVSQGKILYWGTSVWNATQLKRAHQIAEKFGGYAPVVEQPRYNLFDRHIEREILPMARELGMGVVAWSPLAQGLLTGKYNDGVPAGSRAKLTSWLDGELTDANLDRARRFTELAEDAGMPPATLALGWLLNREGISSVITGASRPEQVLQNVEAAEVELSEDLLRAVTKLFAA